MPEAHVYTTVGYKGTKSSITIDLPTGLMHLTVAEALVYADGLKPHNDPVNNALRGKILKAVQRIRDLGGEE